VRSAAVATVAPALLCHPVLLAQPGEYVADGAAGPAARILVGEALDWPATADRWVEAEAAPHVRAAHTEERDAPYH
jgi:xylulokinase